jgi:hypothetical protein
MNEGACLEQVKVWITPDFDVSKEKDAMLHFGSMRKTLAVLFLKCIS